MGRKECGTHDCDFNLVHNLSKKLGFLWRVDQYIKDAKKTKDKECVSMWEKIRDDEKRHVIMMKKALKKRL